MASLNRWLGNLSRQIARGGFRLVKPFLRWGIRCLNQSQRSLLTNHCLALLTSNQAEAVLRELAQNLPIQNSLSLQAGLEAAKNKECQENGLYFNFPGQGSKLARLHAADTPVFLGPWLSEVGFELLYWIPRLRRFLKQQEIAPARVIALSRGGVDSWYHDLASTYVDIFDLITPDEFRENNQLRETSQKGKKKQVQLVPFEQQLLAAAAQKLGIRAYAILHPSFMYSFFKHFWLGLFSQDHLPRWCDYSPLPNNHQPIPGLPVTDYVAMKFYYSDCFPQTPENVRFLRELLLKIATRRKIVLLNNGLILDDHHESINLEHPNIYDATPLMTARNNLQVQSDLIARAQALYCTYGGISYLGPLLGVKTTAFFTNMTFCTPHLELAYKVLNNDSDRVLSVVSTQSMNQLLEL